MKELNEKGQVLLFVTAALLVLILIVGLAIDSGRAYLFKAQLTHKVDPAALAAAAAYKIANSLTAAQTAACNSARMNGLDCTGLSVTEFPITETDGSTTPGIKVLVEAKMATSFMRLGKLIGCTTCDKMTVKASAVASPYVRIDLVMNLDNTGSMYAPINWIGPAMSGANALVDAVVPASSSSSLPKVSLVPFRGCYNSTGSSHCQDNRDYPTGDIVTLTNSNTTLENGISALSNDPGSGTNLCEGLSEARQKLFESPGTVSRSSAQKFIVLLTDGDNKYLTTASFTSPRNCNPSGGSNVTLSVTTNSLAGDIKNGVNVGTSGQPTGTTVTIFVILYGNAASTTHYIGSGVNGDSCAALSMYPGNPTGCDTNGIGSPQCQYARRLAECSASSPGNLYLAPAPGAIAAAFEAIIGMLPVRLAQ